MKRKVDSLATGEIEATAAAWVARCDGGLSALEERDFQRWMESDPRHRSAVNFYRSAWNRLAKPAEAGRGDLLERELSALARRRRRRLTAGGVALAVLLIGGVSWLQTAPRAPARAPTNAVVFSPERQVLPDGSVVELKGNARIVLDYSAALRRVILTEGEAHFAVQSDAARPFVVVAGVVNVRAVGTAFAVQRGAGAVEVIVTEGRVAVDQSAANAPASDAAFALEPAATVSAGSRARVDLTRADAAAEVSPVSAAELAGRLAWRSARLEFTQTSLAEAVELFNRHSSPTVARLVVADRDVATTRVTGVFRADNVDAFVHLLEGAFGVQVDRSGNLIALRKAR